MSKFKAMKFWIGDDPALSEAVQEILHNKGYNWCVGSGVQECHRAALFTRPDGSISYNSLVTDRNNFKERVMYRGHEEINIDWMRTPKKETVELNGKKYLKSELEEALKHIKPMD